MKVLIDINHPAHVHFFKNPYFKFIDSGHEVMVTSRNKEVTTSLLDNFSIPHKILSTSAKKNILSFASELVLRDYRLLNVARKFKPDVMLSIGGTFIAHVGFLLRVPSLVFYDTENAKLQNAITYPFATKVIVPSCYYGSLPKSYLKYDGYHELSYLSPKYFTPDLNVAQNNGIQPEQENYLIRIVSWQANHDLNESGLSIIHLEQIISSLSLKGNIIISSEALLPEQFQKYIYQGDPNMLHHVLAFCTGLYGESATLTSEAAVLGIPSVYIANTGRGYTDEQEKKYGLVKNIHTINEIKIQEGLYWLMNINSEKLKENRKKLLDETVDVGQLIYEQAEQYGIKK
ncbi:DUF354 domain-containing protein [Colwellia sp. TT2012]|uniref:DUF354 domain-containing protein n=1 Tax=Colwellia sp. TT2012 TaxID=1720342 RepID=UPI00070B7037|nr:DUF354 domain-containing protein [Colwellia sp. TT2012]